LKIKILFLLLFLWSFVLNAAQQEMLRRAQIYIEAKMYDKALGTYQEILQGNLNDWQRSIIEFDIGNVYAEQKDWVKALKQYSSIPLGEETSPLVAEHVYTNLGLAHYLLAQELNQKEPNKRNYGRIVYHFKLAGIAFAAAAKKECLIQELGGITPCLVSKELEKLQLATKKALEEAQDKLAKTGGKPTQESKPEIAGPEGLLTKIIELQEQVLDESRLSQKPNKDEQKKVLALADQFIPMVFKEQNEKFSKEGICQSSPWGEVIPHFDEGTQAARQASSFLDEGKRYLTQAISLEEDALTAWRQSLESMKNPKTPKGSCFAGQSQGKSQEKQEKTAEQPASSEEVLRFLQQMNLDDTITPQSIPAIKQVDKPW